MTFTVATAGFFIREGWQGGDPQRLTGEDGEPIGAVIVLRSGSSELVLWSNETLATFALEPTGLPAEFFNILSYGGG